MDIRINGSRESNDGVIVWFENGNDRDFYYAHSINEIGEKEDSAGERSMWGWINHMREKNWWNNELETSFIKEVNRYLV